MKRFIFLLFAMTLMFSVQAAFQPLQTDSKIGITNVMQPEMIVSVNQSTFEVGANYLVQSKVVFIQNHVPDLYCRTVQNIYMKNTNNKNYERTKLVQTTSYLPYARHVFLNGFISTNRYNFRQLNYTIRCHLFS